MRRWQRSCPSRATSLWASQVGDMAVPGSSHGSVLGVRCGRLRASWTWELEHWEPEATDMSSVSPHSPTQDTYSKRFIPVSSISRVASVGDQKFEVVTNNRNFVFRAENDGE